MTSGRFSELLAETGLDDATVESLGGSLVWRVGRLDDEAPVTVRIGLATQVHLFGELPKLRSASEAELQEALDEQNVRVEWVGRSL